jgi:hypothetical protein
LKAAARQRLAAGQGEQDLGLGETSRGGPLPIMSSRMGHLWDALSRGYEVLGFDRVTGGDEVFQGLVLARIIEPASKLDSLRVLEEVGIAAPSYPTVNRRLPVFATDQWRQALAAACAEHAGLGPVSLVLYDVSTLYFETDAGDGFREPGFSKERRLDPQITIGLLTNAAGFPLMVNAFKGNRAETATMLPVVGQSDFRPLNQRLSRQECPQNSRYCPSQRLRIAVLSEVGDFGIAARGCDVSADAHAQPARRSNARVRNRSGDAVAERDDVVRLPGARAARGPRALGGGGAPVRRLLGVGRAPPPQYRALAAQVGGPVEHRSRPGRQRRWS